MGLGSSPLDMRSGSSAPEPAAGAGDERDASCLHAASGCAARPDDTPRGARPSARRRALHYTRWRMPMGGKAHAGGGAGRRRASGGAARLAAAGALVPAALALALAGALVPAARALAQAPAPAAVDTEKPVRVLAVDVEARTLEVAGAGGASGVFHVEPTAPILSGSRRLSLGQLGPGFTLVLDAEERWGRQVVTFVEVLEAPEARVPAAPHD
jgi:hypothetical protein